MNRVHSTQNIFLYPAFLVALVTAGCSRVDVSEKHNVPSLPQQTVWFRQAIVDLGDRIQVLSPTSGFASSRGRGQEVPGRVYRLSSGRWTPVLSYPYSDSPLITDIDSNSFYLIHHLVHTGNCRPVMKQWRSGTLREIPLPKIMWDRNDYVMFKGIARLPDGTMWMVGQQGHILTFDGARWIEVKSPLLHNDQSNMYEGDLHDIAMLSSSSGWAVGRDGVILRWSNGIWSNFESPTRNDLLKISMIDEHRGWIVGDRGTVLKFDGASWRIVPLGIEQRLTSVKAPDSSHAWIVGLESTLLVYNGKAWYADESIKAYEDVFSDVDAIENPDGKYSVWIIGDGGIYSTSQSLGFSFTDITSQAALRRSGRAGIFFERIGKQYPDLLVLGDDGPNLLFTNNGHNIFSETTMESHLESGMREPFATALGDINNDGSCDLLEVNGNRNIRLAYGTSGGRFRFADGHMQFHGQLDMMNSSIAVSFVDFDNDGVLDAYFSNSDNKDVILRNNGTGRFESIDDSLGITKLQRHRSFGATFGDFNNDGRIDVALPYFISEKGKFLDLFLNDGNFQFHPVTDSSFYSQENVASTVCVAADVNNDGNLDLMIHNQGAPPWLLLNDGHARFRNVSSSFGFTTPIFQPDPENGTVAAGDVNNDGWIDFFIASKLFLNQHGERFVEVSEQTGVQFTGHPTFTDIDNDGDRDLFIGSSQRSLGKGDRAALYRNNLNNTHFIKVRVHGDVSNRMAIGATVYVENPDQPSVHQMRHIGIGSSPMVPQDLSEVHFGVLPGSSYTVRVVFPSGVVMTQDGISNGSYVDMTESALVPRAAILTSKSIQRTVQMIEWPVELLKFFSALILIVLAMIAGNTFGAGKLTRRWFFPFCGILVYLLCLHYTITERQLISSAVSFSMLVFGSGISVGVARTVIRKREARYISHYKLFEVLGQGGMGKVYKAMDIHTKQIVALKILNPEIVKDAENKKRLLGEGQVLSSFTHPHIVKVLEVADAAATGFIAMEYLPGGTLKQALELLHPMPLIEIKRILIQICDGLSEVHAHNIVHRDLKTGNIMFDADRNIRIMDFGLSKSPLVTTMTSLGTVLGTLGYVAPEQVTNQKVDQRTDIFSLGVIIYELLTNTLPFKGENEIALIHSIFNVTPPSPSSLRTDVTPEWDSLTAKCLTKNMEERIQSVEEVLQAVHVL